MRVCVSGCLSACADVARCVQVYFLGADTAINYQPSSTWLAEQARFWPWRSHLLMNAPRNEALSVLSMEGMMVVFCSLVENMPYVVAEVPLLPVKKTPQAPWTGTSWPCTYHLRPWPCQLSAEKCL